MRSPCRVRFSTFAPSRGWDATRSYNLSDGRYGLVEIKLGGKRAIEKGASALLKIAGKTDTGHMNPPSFFMGLSGTNPHSFKGEDGVYVVPIGALKD